MVVLITGFVATPYLLRWLGEERFGAFRAASDWFVYLGLLEFGVGGALLALLAKGIGSGDDQAVRDTLAVGIRWYLWITLAIVLVGSGLALSIARLVPVNDALAEDLKRGAFIGILPFLLLPFGAPFKALTDSRQRGYWLHALLLLQSLSITGASLVLAALGWGITGQFVALMIGALFFNAPLIWDGFRRFPGLLRSAVSGPPNPEAERNLRQLNTPTLIYNLAGRFSFETDNIIVALMLGPVRVVPLFITQKLVIMAQGQLTNVGNASWAAMAELHFRGEHELFNQRLIQLTSLVAVLGIAGLVPVGLYNEFFVGRWVGAEFYAGSWITLVVTCNAFARAIVALWGWCFGGTARTPLLVRASVAEALINVVVSVVLTWQLGLIGPVIGTSVGLGAVSLWYLPTLLGRVFGTSVKHLAGAVAAPLAFAVPYTALVWWFAERYPPTGWFDLAAKLAVWPAVFLVVWWLLMLDRSAKAATVQRLLFLVRSKAP